MSKARNLADLLDSSGDVPSTNLASTLDLSGKTVTLPTGVGGKLLSVSYARTAGAIIVSNTTTKLIEGSITTTVANSKLLVTCDLAIGGDGQYNDRDLALALGYKTGAGTSSSTDYTSMNTSTFGRQAVSGLNSWYVSDTQRGGSPGDQYWCESKVHTVLASPSQPAGTVISVAHWASTDSKYWFGVGSAREFAYTDSGSEMSLTIFEIAG
jgi:hypothetical protein